MSSNPSPLLMIIAGEASGDMHGAALVKELKKSLPHMHFFGVGGFEMQRQGVELVHTVKDLAVLGAIEIIRHYPRLRRIFHELIDMARLRKPDAVILIDYPGFNIRLARFLKRHNIPVIYYISPQIWAWGQHRRKTIAERVDKMLVFFDFEKDFYHDTSLDVEFIGHPLVDNLPIPDDRHVFFERIGCKPEKPIVGLLPGSRENEIKRLLPIMLRTASIIQKKMPETQFVLPVGNVVPKDTLLKIFNTMTQQYPFKVKILENGVVDTMAYADLVLIASGTATLETACYATPMIIVYKVNFITALLARAVIKIPYIGLVNVVAGNKVVPEFLQGNARPQRIAHCIEQYLSDSKELSAFRNELKKIKARLGQPGAVHRAAGAVIRFLDDVSKSKK
ncbi:MAG: lipid-A-disaccharide synthase [bacterium]|nr:lipid-A-disaccharide synthase [bacterium]